jgi:acyl dehydratase
MSKQVYFEDITAGDEIPHRVVETLTTRSIVKWAAAVKDFYEIHYDKDFARAVGMRDVIAQGQQLPRG